MRPIDGDRLFAEVQLMHKAVDTADLNQDYDTGYHSATSAFMGLIASMPTVDGSPCWVQVEDKLPQPYERVLVCCMTKKGIQTQNLAYFADGFWHGQGSMSGVTHWMSLPMPPINGGNAL